MKHWADGYPYKPGFQLGKTSQKKNQALHAAAELRVAMKPDSGLKAAKKLYHAFKRGKMPDDLSGAIWRIVKDLDDVTYNAYRYFFYTNPFCRRSKSFIC